MQVRIRHKYFVLILLLHCILVIKLFCNNNQGTNFLQGSDKLEKLKKNGNQAKISFKYDKTSHAKACRKIALQFLNSSISNIERYKAIKWFKIASYNGDLPSMLNLYSLLMEHNQTEEAHAWKLCYNNFTSIDSDLSLDNITGKALEMSKEIMDKIRLNQSLPLKKSSKYKNNLSLGNGDVYSGNTLNDLPHGSGRKETDAGSYYIGEFQYGVEHGYGKWFNKSGRLIREGNWINGNPTFNQ